MAIFAATLEKTAASAFAFIALLMLIVSNLAFYVYYRRYTVHDSDFSNWIRLYPRTQWTLPLACSVINLKLIRFSYSGFFSWDVAEARFSHPIENLHKPLKMLTYFQYVFVYVPIFIADLVIFAQVPWGHQLLVLAIETFVL